MSRLCVKNIPKYVDEADLKSHFQTCFTKGSNGEITDVKILKTKDGRSRKIGFIGFKNENDALLAQKYFNKSFMDTSKLSVEIAKAYGDASLARPWSKHSKMKNTSVPDKTSKPAGDMKQKNSKGNPPAKVTDKKLQDFLMLMQPRSKTQFWANDDGATGKDEKKSEPGSEKSDDESDSDSEIEKETANEESGAASNKKQEVNEKGKKEVDVEEVAENGRLFIRNLSYSTTEKELEKYFLKFGPIAECHIPTDESNRSRGFGYITYVVPENAVRAMAELDMQIFHGRLLHVIPGMPKQQKNEDEEMTSKSGSSYQQKKDLERRKKAEGDTVSWNALFVRSDAALGAVANEIGATKGEMLDETNDESKTSAALRMALSETRVIAETKEFLKNEGIDIQALEHGIRNPSEVKRSDTCMLLKNLPLESNIGELRQMFARYGSLEKFVLPPSKTMALVSFYERKAAKKCFKGLAYKRYKRVPIYLEWAPDNVVKASDKGTTDEVKDNLNEEEHSQASGLNTLFVKNLNFDTNEEALKAHFLKLGGKDAKNSVMHVSIPRKNKTLSMGYGFVQMVDAKACRNALRRVHESTLDGHVLEVKISRKTVAPSSSNKAAVKRKDVSGVDGEAKNTKIIVRNLAFEATKKELKQLFSAYGQVNTVRLPKKYDGSHRGFAFVDFVTNQEAKTAFQALSTTHLYGRKLVIEWAEDTQSLDALREKSTVISSSPQKKQKPNTEMDMDAY